MADDPPDPLDPVAEEDIKALLDQLRRATVRLAEIEDGEKLPKRMASGFIVQRNGRCFVITAGHAIASGRWWLELDAKRNGDSIGILVPFTSRWVLAAEISLPGKVKAVDFAWAEVDVERLRSDAAKNASLDTGSVEFVEYRGPLDHRPEAEEPYAFCALNQPIAGPLPEGRHWLERRPSYEVGMEFIGEREGNATYVFKLARKHQGHRYYKGASGAPIADATGKIVSVVLGGDENDDVVYGGKLADYAHLIGEELRG